METPLVMGIINATPDSFYRGDLGGGRDGILSLAVKMISEGADILDIGGQSTRPGSTPLTAEEEMKRLIPVIQMIAEKLPDMIISADTFHSEVAIAAVDAGATIINDISGGEADAAMITTVAALGTPYICMHMKGTPQTMREFSVYKNVTQEVLDHFILKVDQCKAAGINDVIIDPGFGFAKTPAQNFRLLKDLPVFGMLETPILVGLSRKSTVYKTLNIPVENALNGTTVLNTLALNNGASILRVHDVKEAKEAITLYRHYNGN